SLTAVSSLITILTIPFIVTFAMENFVGESQVIALNIPAMIGQIFAIVVIPVLIGMLVRRFKPEFAERMGKPVRIASGAVLALIIIGLVIKERSNFSVYFEQAGVATLLLNILSMSIGYASARLFRLTRDNAISISIESGIQNGTLAITIAVVLLQNTAFAIAPAVYSLLMFLTGGVMIYIFGKRKA
ncbi:MAG: bile acid:sodium symporter, partial [Marinirhabdus sp.]|nr:bile acid:sodium symporter [Marinirhabdus sp.]